MRGYGRAGRLVATAPVRITDGAVIAFAIWTVLYHAALLVNLAPSVTFRVWLALCLAAGGFAAFRAVRRRATTAADASGAGTVVDPGALVDPGGAGTGTGPVAGRRRRRLLGTAVALGLLAALLAGARRPWLPWLPWVATEQPQKNVRELLEPAGHPCCLCLYED